MTIDTSKHYQIMRDARARTEREAAELGRSLELALCAFLWAVCVWFWLSPPV